MGDKIVETKGDDKEQKSAFWNTGPGPAGVMLPPTLGMINHDKTRKQEPAYSLGLKLPSIFVEHPAPGPCYAIPYGMTAKGPAPQLSASLKERTKVIEPFNTTTPGPAAYDPDVNVNRRKGPCYSISWRTPLRKTGKDSPGPIYLLPPCIGPRIPDKPAAAECSIKGKSNVVDKALQQSPGPIYDIGSPNLIKGKLGEVTIKGRWKPLKAQSCEAGPASYNLENSASKTRNQPPCFSMGIRHSQFAGVFMTDCDKSENSPPNFDDC